MALVCSSWLEFRLQGSWDIATLYGPTNLLDLLGQGSIIARHDGQ